MALIWQRNLRNVARAPRAPNGGQTRWKDLADEGPPAIDVKAKDPMATYPEEAGQTLLTGATDPDGDPISVYRVNGAVVDWSTSPHRVSLTKGAADIWSDGTVAYDDGGTSTGHPSTGEILANGAFSFTLWDGIAESPVYTCNLELAASSGSNAAPTGENHNLTFDVAAP